MASRFDSLFLSGPAVALWDQFGETVEFLELGSVIWQDVDVIIERDPADFVGPTNSRQDSPIRLWVKSEDVAEIKQGQKFRLPRVFGGSVVEMRVTRSPSTQTGGCWEVWLQG